jgi:hypothetical protein
MKSNIALILNYFGWMVSGLAFLFGLWTILFSITGKDNLLFLGSLLFITGVIAFTTNIYQNIS